MAHGQRSPGSQALSGMTSVVNAPIPPRPGSSFAPATIRGKSKYVEEDGFSLDPIPQRPSRSGGGGGRTSSASPNFGEIEMDSRKNPIGSHGKKSPVRSGSISSTDPYTNKGPNFGVQRPLPPQAGSAVSANPFARTTPTNSTRNESPNVRRYSAGYDDL